MWANWKRRPGGADRWQRLGSIRPRCPSPILGARVPFLGIPSVVLSWPGPGWQEGKGLGRGCPASGSLQGVREGGSEGKRVRDRRAALEGNWAAPGFGVLLASPTSLVQALLRAGASGHKGASGLRCPCRGPPRPAALPGRAAARAPSLAARCALRQGRRRRRVLLLSLRSSRASQRSRREGERKGEERGERKREREGGSEARASAEPPRTAAPPRSQPLAWSEETRSPPPPEPGPAISSPPARRCPRGPGTPLPARRPGCSRGMAAGPLSPAAGSAEPVSNLAPAARASPLRWSLPSRGAGWARGWGWARPGEGRTGPRRGRRGWWGRGVAERGRGPTRGRSGRGGALGVRGLPAGSGLSGFPPGLGSRGTWSSPRPEGRFCEWEGPGVGLHGEARESRALVVLIVAAVVVAAVAAQCPAWGTPWRGEAEREEIPSPRGASGVRSWNLRGWERPLGTQSPGTLPKSSRRRVHRRS